MTDPVFAALAAHGFPTARGPGLGFTPEDDARLARGWPNLRLLTDEAVAKKAAIKAATKALDAGDPALPRRVPRDVAARYLAGYVHGPNLGFAVSDDEVGRLARRAEAVEAGGEVTLDRFVQTLHGPHFEIMGDTYGAWRYGEVAWLTEAFLGTAPVARAIVDRLVEYATDLPAWDFAGEDPYRDNAAGHNLARALAPMLPRLDAGTAAELRARLRAQRDPEDVGDDEPREFFKMLRVLADPSPGLLDELDVDFTIWAGIAPRVEALLEDDDYTLYSPARFAWLVGTGFLARPIRAPGYLPQRMVEAVAPIRDPGVVRLVATLATQRAAKNAAIAWLREHADYAEPILRSLARVSDAREQKAVAAGLEAFGEAPPAPTKALTAAQAEKEIRGIFKELATKLRSTGDEAQWRAAIRAAYERYVEARSAANDPLPEAYFTHRFGDYDLGEWGMLAVDVLEEG